MAPPLVMTSAGFAFDDSWALGADVTISFAVPTGALHVISKDVVDDLTVTVPGASNGQVPKELDA